MNVALLKALNASGALAPRWEVKTAKMQADAGAVNAGLSEEVRAGKAGLAASVDTAYAASHPNDPTAKFKRVGKFMAVGLDLDGNGTVSTNAIPAAGSTAAAAVTFNWDHTGFQKKVAWVAPVDGMLVLDKDFNESIDDGAEMLSNPLVADPAKGLRSLATWDANNDGVIDSLDPVFRQLKVWQDFNQDGNNTNGQDINGTYATVQDEHHTDSNIDGPTVKELRSLADMGITAIDYNNNRYTTSTGAQRNIKTVELDAQNEGTAYTRVGAGIRIDSTGAKPEILITKIQSEQAVYDATGGTLRVANESIGTLAGSTIYEDGSSSAFNPSAAQRIKQTIYAYGKPSTDPNQTIDGLLDNDTFKGRVGEAAKLKISAVSNASHVEVALTAEGNLEYYLEPNFNGDAGFDYTVTAPDGSTKTARVTLSIASVDDPAIIAASYDAERAIYGYDTRAYGKIVLIP